MKGFFKRILTDEGGQAITMVALLLVVLIGIAALVIDVGMAYTVKAKMQNAADAAALAGAQKLPTGNTAKTTAKNYADLNGVDIANVGNFKAETPYGGNANRIEVTCKKNVPYSLAGILGFTGGDVSARAVAEKTVGGDVEVFDYAIFSGDPKSSLVFEDGSFEVQNNGKLRSNGNFLLDYVACIIRGSAEASGTIRGTERGYSFVIDTCKASKIDIPPAYGNAITKKIVGSVPILNLPNFSGTVQSRGDKGLNNYKDTTINLSTDLYIDGDLMIKDCTFEGQGVILATGDITIDGEIGRKPGASAIIYSMKDMIVNSSNIDIGGILYAPDGTIQMGSGSLTIYGRIIGNTITFARGTHIFRPDPNDLGALPPIASDGSTKLIE